MSTKPKSTPATAPGQALGYGLQYTRLTAMLLAATEGSVCSLEVLDDVAEATLNGHIILGQTKSALTGNPVADRAIALWKTLFNWLQLVQQGYVDPNNTIFELYVSRKVEGELIKAFHKSSVLEDAALAVGQAREHVWGKAPAHPNKANLPEDLARYANPVLSADSEILLPIITNLRLECGSGSPQADIEAVIRRAPVSPSKVFDIADKLCGWVKRKVDKQLEQGLPAVIARDEFHREYRSYVRLVDRELILHSLSAKPSDAEKLARLPDKFVQQLDLIECTFDDKLAGISDFLRACSDRTLWSMTGDVHEDSFAELDDNLNRTWRNLNRALGVEAGSKPAVERGILLHARCMIHQGKVQGMEPPAHFVPGCFHRLADAMVIGWHPDYRRLLEKAGADK